MPHPDDYDDRGDDRGDDRSDDRRRDDDRHDDRRDDDYDDYEERPRRGGRRRALEKVSLPALCLMILGGLGLAFASFRTLTDIMMGDEAMDNNPFIKNDPGMKDFQK